MSDAEGALKIMPGEVTLREYIESLFVEQHRANEIAERERNKAADVLAKSLAEAIREGDQNLRVHIASQVDQIAAALSSAEKLSSEQIATVSAKIVSQREEMILRDASARDLLIQANTANDLRVREAFAASEAAIDKAEQATEKRLEGLNAMRDQLRDQAGTFMLREIADSQFGELRKLISEIAERLGKLT